MKIIDVSGRLENGMWSYGGPYPPTVIEQVCRVDDDTTVADYRVNVHRMTLCTCSGTYITAPSEMDSARPPIDAYDASRFVLDATMFRFVPKRPNEACTLREFRDAGVKPKPGDAVILVTGWESHWTKPDFVEGSPWIAPDAVDWLIERGVSMIAGDMTVYDNFKSPTGNIKKIFGADMLILAPLVHLDAITEPVVKLVALPLKVTGAAGAPARAVVIEGGLG